MIKWNYRSDYFPLDGSLYGVYKGERYLLKKSPRYGWILIATEGQKILPEFKFLSEAYPYTLLIDPYELSSVYSLCFRGICKGVEVIIIGQNEELSQLRLVGDDLSKEERNILEISIPADYDQYMGGFYFYMDEKEVSDVWEERKARRFEYPFVGEEFPFTGLEKVYLKKDGVWINE